jgi:YHS domain-containing protein
MRKVLVALASSALPSLAQPSPGPSGSCTDASFGPVLAGVDFVDLKENKKELVDAPDFGSSALSAELNGYTFWFKSGANRDKFAADPWAYAPAYGGF